MFLNRWQWAKVLKTLFWGVAALAIASCFYILVYGSNRIAIVVCGAGAALVMFLIRLRFRLVYRLAEIVFGLFVLWDASGKGRGAFSSDFSRDFDVFQITVVLLQTFAAVYVLIRGLDNCYQSLSAPARKWIAAKIGSQKEA